MQIVEHDSFIVVGIPVRATWNELWQAVPTAWAQLRSRIGEIAPRADDVLLDVSLEQDGGKYLQLVGARVSKAERVPEGMMAVEVPAQRYIHHRHTGSLPAIAEAFGAMYAWAEEQAVAAGSFKVDSGYPIEDGESADALPHDLFVGVLPETDWREVRV